MKATAGNFAPSPAATTKLVPVSAGLGAVNTVEYEKGKIVPAKRKYNPYSKVLSIGNGFPDFVCFKKIEEDFDVIGLEVKAGGYLDKIEKGMCIWLLENKIFSRILIARKGKKRGEIEYVDFKEKYLEKKK